MVSWIDGDFKSDEALGDSIKMVDNESSSMKNQNFVQTKWIDGDFKTDSQIGDKIKMRDDIEMDFSNQDLVQVHHKLPVDDHAEVVQDRWESVMESLGHMNERTDYDPKRKSGEGYYTLKSNNADEAADVKWEPIAPLEILPSDETEKVLELQPLSYQDRAIMNYFGYRTTFYGQLEEDVNDGAEEEIPYYNSKAGIWMGPSLVALPVDDQADLV